MQRVWGFETWDLGKLSLKFIHQENMVFKVCCLLSAEVILKWLYYTNLSDEVPDNEEKPKGTDTAHVGQGSADCLALHKKGLHIAGQVCRDQITSSLC